MPRALEISFLFLLGGMLPAQQERQVATKPSEAASERFEELARLHAERVKGGPGATAMNPNHPDFTAAQKAQQDAVRARVRDLQSFLEQFPRGPESIRARLEIAQFAVKDDRFAELGTKVLEALEVPEVDLPSLFQFMTVAERLGVKTEAWLALAAPKVAKADMRTTLQAATLALKLGFEEQKAEWVQQAVAKVKTQEDHLFAARALLVSLQDEDGCQKLLTQADKAARSPDERARVLMEKVAIVRAAKRGDEAKAVLQEIVNLYPSTPMGQIAKGQLDITQITVGDEPIPFVTRDLSGKDVATTDYTGKVLLIQFWATWCGPCKAEMPNVVDAYGKYRAKGFEVLGISLDRATDREKLEAFLKESKIEWRQVFDGGNWGAEIAQLYGVKAIPYTVLVGRDGKVIATNVRGKALGEEVKLAVEAAR